MHSADEGVHFFLSGEKELFTPGEAAGAGITWKHFNTGEDANQGQSPHHQALNLLRHHLKFHFSAEFRIHAQEC